MAFPNTSSLRIDYGQALDDIAASVVNNTGTDVKMRVRIMIRSVDKGDLVFGKPLFTEAAYVSKKGSPGKYLYDKKMKVEKTDFQPGHYFVEADIHIMEATSVTYQPPGKHPQQKITYKKAQRLDSVTKSFWVQQDPPEGGIWERIDMVEFPKAYPGQRAEHMRSTQVPPVPNRHQPRHHCRGRAC